VAPEQYAEQPLLTAVYVCARTLARVLGREDAVCVFERERERERDREHTEEGF
jgi:hypothetical protein